MISHLVLDIIFETKIIPCVSIYHLVNPAKTFCTLGVSVKSCLDQELFHLRCYISLFREIILQHLDDFQTDIEGFLKKLSAFKAPWGHP